MKTFLTTIFIFIFLFRPLSSLAQQFNEVEVKVAYLFAFAKNITWGDKSESNSFTFGVIGEREVYKELQLKSNSGQLKNKSISVKYFKDYKSFTDVDLLYIGEEVQVDLQEINHLIKKRNVLLVTSESPELDQLMVNFKKNNEANLTFEINRINLEREGFIITKELLLLGGTEMDIIELFNKTEETLKREIRYAETLKKEIDTKKREIENLESNMDSINLKVKRQQILIQGQEQEIMSHQSELDYQKNKISEQEDLLNKLKTDKNKIKTTLENGQNSLKLLQELLLKEQYKIDDNKAIIASNHQLIEDQKGKLSIQRNTIDRNKMLLYFSIAFLVIFLILALVIFAGYKRKIRSNEILKTKNEQILSQGKIIEKQSAIVHEKARHKEEFLANMSHEIRTPINTIVGYVQLLSNQPLNETQQGYLNNVKMASNHLLYQVNDLLDYSKIEAGKVHLEALPFDLHKVVHDSVSSLEIVARDKGLLLEVLNLKAVPRYVIGDYIKLHQVLINLIGNAVKFTHKGKVAVELTEISRFDNSTEINFKIIDTGIGISEENQKHIFEKFSQSDNSITRKFGGTGLGLTISKTLVDLFGGKLDVKSVEDEGSEFFFTISLPLASEKEFFVDTEENLKVDNIENVEILLADDNEINRLMLIQMLTDWNPKVKIDEAKNGLEVIDMVITKKYDLILMDLQMPKLNGLEASEYIRTKLKSDIKIIALTANTTKNAQENCEKVGMNGFLLKPYVLNDVIKSIGLQLDLKITQTAKTKSIPKEKPKYAFKHLDINRLLKTYKKDKEVKDILQSILLEIDEGMKALELNYTQKKWESFIKTAHSLLNKAPYVGGEEYVKQCRTIESKGRKRLENIEEDISLNNLNEMWSKIRVELIAFLDSK